MIEEDYVSFETAKLLKEKGFDVYVPSFYDVLGEFNKKVAYWNWNAGPRYSAPTLQMTMKYLRARGWFICIIPLAFYGGEKASKFGYNIWADDNLEVDEFDTPTFNTYEDACEAAINYCLKYLN